MQYQQPDNDLEKPSRASMEEYSAFIRAESPHRPRPQIFHITPCAGGLILLVTACIYLLLLLRNLPLQVQFLLEDHGYKGPLPMKYDATHGPFIECPASTSPNNPPNCSFYLLAHGWVPNPCFNVHMHTDMLATRSYEFYRSPFGHQKLAQDAHSQGNMSMYDLELWVQYSPHVDSCLYLLNGSVRATGVRLVGRLDSWLDDRLMQHCFDAIRTNGDPMKTQGRVKTVIGFRRCYLRGS